MVTMFERSLLQDKMWFEYFPIEGRDELELEVTSQKDAISSLCDLVNIVQEIADSTGRLCEAVKFGNFTRLFIQHTGLSKELVSLLKRIGEVKLFQSEFELHPYIELMFDINDNYLLQPKCILLTSHLRTNAEEYVEQVNEIVDMIRSCVKSKEMAREVKNYQRGALKNYESAGLYVRGLFRRHAKIMIVRIDLSYAKGVEVDIDTAQKHRDRLFSNARKNKIFKEMIGFIWKMEFGILKGYHHHVILFFDGSKVREDVTYAKMVGEYWKYKITNGDGLYYNCNAVKNKYSKCGIGLLTHRDKDKMQGLDEAVKYLTITDKFIKIKMSGIRRTFGKGQVKERPVKLGRPRIE